MKKNLYIFLIIVIGFASEKVHAQTCASSSNIYTFTAAGINYEIVKELKTWAQASSCAVARGGYLVHIDNQAEQTAVYGAIVASGIASNYHAVADGGGASYLWIGATDKNVEGAWLWDGNNDNIGTNFWNGQGAAGLGTGSVVGTNYVNWGGKSTTIIKEPDDYLSSQDGAGLCLGSWPYGIAGEWNDISAANTLYYVIEFPAVSAKIIEVEKDNNIRLFPNPTKDVFEIKSDVALKQITLTTVDGKLIQTLPATKTVDLSGLANGIYFIEIITIDNKVIKKKLVKE